MKPIKIDEDSWINPLDIVLNPNDEYTRDKEILKVFDISVSIYEYLLNRELTEIEVQVIYGACRDVFTRFIEELDNKHVTHDFNSNPTLFDVNQTISNRKVACELADHLKPFEDYLSKRTNITDSERLSIIYPGKFSVLTQIIRLAQLNFAFNRAKLNYLNEKYTWIYIEDADQFIWKEGIGLIFNSFLKESKFLKSIITLSYQECDPDNPAWQRICNNINYFQLFYLHEIDKTFFAKALDISDKYMKYTEYPEPGCGLMVTGKNKFPVDYRQYYDSHLKEREQK